MFYHPCLPFFFHLCFKLLWPPSMTHKTPVVPLPVFAFCFQGHDTAQCGSDSLVFYCRFLKQAGQMIFMLSCSETSHFMKELPLSHFAKLLE